MKFAQVAKKETPAHKEPLEKVYEDDEWAVYIPHTYRASRQIGQDTHWCTASSNPNYYKSYTQDGDLYVNIRKTDGAKFQIHFESSQAMDADDEPVALGEIGISEGLKNFYLQRALLLSFLKIYYKDYYGFSDGLAAVELNDKFGFIDKTGREVIPLIYDNAYSFSNGLAVVALNGKYGFIDETGRVVIPFKYDGAKAFSEGLARVLLKNKYGYIDENGKEVIPFKYDFGYDFFDGFARVILNNKYGFIDKTGREICPCKYDWAGDFCEELATVKLNWKFGYIDKTGKEVIPLKYDYASEFSAGLATSELHGNWGYIDKQGNWYWYDKKPSILPESITKITISDIRYMSV